MEHWRNKNGSFGLFIVDGKKAQGWDKIDQIIKQYSTLHPKEIDECIRKNKQTRETRKNKYASSQKLRWGASLPVGLMLALEKAEPKLFSNKRMYHQFIKKYKQFSVCQTV
jgi:hypothetical protein